MPHLILEYSKNIAGELDFEPLFVTLHKLLEEKLPTDISSCKSRCIPQEVFFIGDCHVKNAFAHLTLKILAGRTDENKNQLGNEILTVMRNFFQPHKYNLILQLTVEVVDLDKYYFKVIA
ncbi:MAG: 5-carboxymethyl-2-hydroxymuconate Delta-isomerase [Legionellaceae bacterium]|nr:5-carboxymethyl-2-hydroxymuconate Delta-isomerase [Legionellaceae bacterium]